MPVRVAYLSLQAVVEGQDSWAAVTEVIAGFRSAGWVVDEYFPQYPDGFAHGVADRLHRIWEVQQRLTRSLGDYDLVYARGHMLAWPVCSAAFRRGVPVVQECNGTLEDAFIAWPASRAFGPVMTAMMMSQYRTALVNIAVTRELAAWIDRLTGRSDALVSPNGANIDIFRPDAPTAIDLPERYAVFFGQLAPWQGVGVMLDAVRDAGWPTGVKLVVIGDGAMRRAVEDATGVGQVVYLGRLPYHDVAGVVARSVASLVPMFAPTRVDTGLSPLKLFESMACGVPVVASDTSGIAEAVQEADCGIAVRPGDSAAIASAVAMLAASPDEAAAMGTRGRQAAEHTHSWRARSLQRMRYIEQAYLEFTGEPLIGSGEESG